MAPIRIDDMFIRILNEFDTARGALTDAALWAKSDWSDGRVLTSDEAAARAAVFAVVQDAKQAIDQAKSHILRALDNRRRRG